MTDEKPKSALRKFFAKPDDWDTWPRLIAGIAGAIAMGLALYWVRSRH